MEALVFLLILLLGALVFAVIGVIGLLGKTGAYAEQFDRDGARLGRLEARLQKLEDALGRRTDGAGDTDAVNAMTDAANATADNPNAMADNPNAMADDPKAMADNPKAMADNPKAMADDPNATADDVKAMADDPKAMANEPKAMADDPKATADAVKAMADDVKAMADEPNAMADGAKAMADNPNAMADEPNAAPAILTSLSNFIHGGNLWAAGGVALLIAAFAMLITYLARHGFFTVEMGIAAAALSGLVMLGAGWRLRKKRRIYFLLLQGGGIGILYLSVFAANRLTPWFPAPVTLVFLSFLILPAVFLALLQGAQVLAFFGFLGGFAAPILLSPVGGNHLFLFSYYLVLDLGVLVIGYFRFWKGLNLLAFLCTFAAALIWVYGGMADGAGRTEVFSAEPFFLAYILLFTLLGLHAVRRKGEGAVRPRRGGYIEWGLIFGTPLLGALIQWQVFSYVEHGYAIASIAFSAFYLSLAFIIWKIRVPAIFVEGYLGFSVLLANLAIPLELSSRITSAVWAAEGVVVYFFGLRFRRRKVWIAALLLHAAAALAFIPEMDAITGMGVGFGGPPYRSPRFIGALIIALSALAIVLLTRRLFPREDGAAGAAGIAEGAGAEGTAAADTYTSLIVVFTLWGCAWWFGAWLYEFFRIAAEPWPLFFILSSLSALLFFGAAKFFRCAVLTAGAVPSLCCALALFLAGLGTAVGRAAGYAAAGTVADGASPFALFYFNYFEGRYLWGWLAFFAAQTLILLFSRREIREKVHAPWLFVVALIAAAALSLSGRYLTLRLGLAESWTSFAGLLPLFAALILVSLLRSRFNPPLLHRRLLFLALPVSLCVILGFWFVVTLFMPGNPSPLPLYLPLLNPLDLEELFCIVLFLFWQNAIRRAGDEGGLSRRSLLVIADGALFLALTAVIARSVHFYGRVPYWDVPRSEVFQLCLFVFWAVWGIAHIVGGNRIKLRRVWIAGAVLTVADIVKLLVLDLKGSGTVIRIVSFFIAGLILLFIGWTSPLPPAKDKTAAVGGATEEK